MRTMTIFVSVALTLAVFGLVAGADAEKKQSGENSDCLDFNVLYSVGGVHSPLAEFVDVNANANYTVSAPDGGTAFIDFYNETGVWVGWNAGAPTGTVHPNAVYGTMCVGVAGTFPDVPLPGATWTYEEEP